MRNLMAVGAILFFLGVLGLAVPYFTTSETKDVAKVGDFKLQATEETSHAIPPVAAGGVLLLGLVLLGAGFVRKA